MQNDTRDGWTGSRATRPPVPQKRQTRAEIIDRYRRTWEHSDATINALPIDAPGHVPWWPRPDVLLFSVMVHVLTETNRHAGHADILCEQLDGAVGTDVRNTASPEHDAAYWEAQRAKIERAAKAAMPTTASRDDLSGTA